MEDKKVLEISEDYLKEIIDFSSRKTVGKTMKRFELFDSKDILKKNIKELIYEAFRDFEELIYSYNKGKELSQFKFIRRDESSK